MQYQNVVRDFAERTKKNLEAIDRPHARGSEVYETTQRLRARCPVPIQVDRVVFDVWIGQPVDEGAILKRVEVQPKKAHNDVFFKSMLSGAQHQSPPSRRWALGSAGDSKHGCLLRVQGGSF